MIRLEHLQKSYNKDSTPLRDVNAEIHAGDVISVIGPSGSGKSTLLRCINLLEPPTSGHIWLEEEDITRKECDLQKVRQKMGMVFQHFNLFGHMTVIENVMYAPVKLLHKTPQEAYDYGMRFLKQVGMADRALRFPDTLSGGQKQRVAIARTLAMDPDIILLDEPTNALDPTMVSEVQSVIEELAAIGKTMMIVTHEMGFARAICNRVFYMDEGGIYEEGTPEQIFDHPQKEKTRRFIHQLKVLELLIESRNYDFQEADARIAYYCDRHHMSERLKYHVLLVFEELVKEILVPRIDRPRVRFVTEYSHEREAAVVDVYYDGAVIDLEGSSNIYSWPMLRAAATELTHTAESENGLSNHVHIVLR